MTSEDKKTDKRPLTESKEYFLKCPTHGLRFPSGANCPACEADKGEAKAEVESES